MILKTVSVNTKHHVTLHISEYHRSLHAPCSKHAISPFCMIVATPVLIVTCFQSSDVSRSLGRSPYRHGWSWLMPSTCQYLSDKGAPIKACTICLRGLGAMSTERVVAVDLPHYQHNPHFQSCWQNNLDLEAVKWKTVVKVGMASLCPLTQVMHYIYPRRVQTHYDFLYFISRQHTSPFRTGNIATLHFQQNLRTANASNSKISAERSRTSASCLVV